MTSELVRRRAGFFRVQRRRAIMNDDEAEELGSVAGNCTLGGDDRPRIIPNKNRALQLAPAPGRHLFNAERKRVFLEWFAGTANLSLSAREAGVHYRTVLRHRMEDAAFRADFDAALEQGEARLRAWLLEAKDDGRTDFHPAAAAPAHLTAEEAMRLYRDNTQRIAAVARASGGGRPGRMPRVATNAEVRAALITRLAAYGVRIYGEPPDPPAREAMGEEVEAEEGTVSE
jgi:hypothetical protein